MDDYLEYNVAGTSPPQVVADETPQQPAPATSTPATLNTGTTQAGSPGTNTANVIGIRPYNPLSLYSSYTYQLSLYMITPDAYDEFNKSGRKNILLTNNASERGAAGTGGAFLIAQSGGINDDSTRAPGFHFDYFIDNLQIKSAVSPQGAGGATVNYEMSFTITEQYGLSFVTNLKRAKQALEAYSSTINYKESSNASRQFFILGIRFLGYDANGNLITQSPLINEPDPTFQRFYDIQFTKVGFKLDGKTTTYNIEAATIPITAGLGQKRGVIDKGANQLTGNTVGDILNKLMIKVTEDQEKDTKTDPQKRQFANTYKIQYLGDAVDIENSSIVSSADLSKMKWPMAAPKDKTTVNPNLSINAQPNSKERIMAFNRDTPILQAITSVITQSDYLVNGLKSVYSAEEQPDPKTDSPESKKNDSNKRLKWFSVTPLIENTRFDNILKDWTFDITYQIRTYEIPILKSPYADSTTPYYGAVKRYEYWWTGQNSEVLKYEQSMNNAYFTVALSGADASSAATGGNAQVPIVTGKRQSADRLGKMDVGKEAQNSVVTDLTSPGDWAEAKLEILGDPDWLSNPTPTGNETDKSFYGPDGYTVDFNAGQVFIEIKFLEAVDYDHNKGVMNLNDKILFWDYPVSIAEKLQGAISYRVITIKHNFRAGKFTQELTCAINTFGDVGGPKMSEQLEAERENQAYSENEMARLQNRSTGLAADPTPSAGTTGGTQRSVTPNQAKTEETNTQGVANDDASASGSGTYYSWTDGGDR